MFADYLRLAMWIFLQCYTVRHSSGVYSSAFPVSNDVDNIGSIGPDRIQCITLYCVALDVYPFSHISVFAEALPLLIW